MRRYPVPWRQVLGLWPHIAAGSRAPADRLYAAVAGRIAPPPRVLGAENIPLHPRFLVAANHYQRKGLWIVHPASVIARAVQARLGPTSPPMRWVVTANWPRVHILGRQFPSPGDWLLARVAHALSCYPVPFAGSDPAFAARSLRRLLREAPAAGQPTGLFPEGAAGAAGRLSDPLPGVDRLIAHLARRGLPVLPAGIFEDGDTLVVRFGSLLPAGELASRGGPARLVMARIAPLAAP